MGDGAGPARRAPRLALVAVPVMAAALAGGLVLGLGGTGGAAAPVRLAAFSLPGVGPSGAQPAAPVTYPLTGAAAGRPVVLVFFASWCIECRADLPVVARVAAAEARAGNRAVFLAIDGNDAPARGWAFAHQRGVRFPIADDEREQVANQLRLTGLPSTAVVDAQGQVVRRFTGLVSAATLEAAVAQVAPHHAAHPGG